MRTFLTNARIGREARENFFNNNLFSTTIMMRILLTNARIGQEARIGWDVSENFFNNNLFFDNKFDENFIDVCQNWPRGQMDYTLSFT
jgi:hypothetical protein